MAELPANDEHCFGTHPPDPHPHPELTRIRWYPMRPTGEHVRVQAYTCACRPTSYELCQIGGQCFIRRTRRTRKGVYVDESLRSSVTRTSLLWAILLAVDPVEPGLPTPDLAPRTRAGVASTDVGMSRSSRDPVSAG